MQGRLSAASEDRLRQCLGEMLDQVEQGTAPTQALAKVASAHRLPPGHVQLMARTYNISASETHRKSAQSLSEKLESFPLASASEVLSELYPDQVPTLGSSKEAQLLSQEYALAPPVAPAERPAQKYAGVDFLETKGPGYVPPQQRSHLHQRMDPDWPKQQARTQIAQLQKEAEVAHGEEAYAREEFRQTLHQLGEYLQRSTSPSWQTLKEAAAHHLGAAAGVLVEGLPRLRPLLDKVASTRAPIDVDTLVPGKAPLSLVARALECATRQLEKVARSQQKRAALLQIPELGRPFRRPVDVLDVPLRKAAGLDGIFTSAMGTTLGGEITKRLPGGKSVGDMQDKVYKQLTDPDQEAELRNARLTASLSQLHATDPIISGYPLEQVTGAANGIGQISPRALESQELMRSLIRKHLAQGSMDPFEIESLLKIEKGLKTRDSVSEGDVSNELKYDSAG